jgi:hypothetical protein
LAAFHVAADCDCQAENFNGQAAEDESCPRGWGGKEHQRGKGQKKSGWHDQQARVFHGPLLSGIRLLSDIRPGGRPPSGPRVGQDSAMRLNDD